MKLEIHNLTKWTQLKVLFEFSLTYFLWSIKILELLDDRPMLGQAQRNWGCLGCTCTPCFLERKGQNPPWTFPLFESFSCRAPLNLLGMESHTRDLGMNLHSFFLNYVIRGLKLNTFKVPKSRSNFIISLVLWWKELLFYIML